MISVVITSFNRLDLLKRTIASFNRVNDYLIKEFIIIEDSADKDMHEALRYNFPYYTLILNEKNLGAYESIDIAYSHVTTPYVVHIEDDWEFSEGGFIEPSLKILENNKSIMQINLSNNNQPIETDILDADGVKYNIFGTDADGYWHGFTCNPNVKSVEAYRRIAPWTQWSTPEDFLALRELKVGKEYFRLGYRAAYLNKQFCTHIGLGRCTWHLNN